MKSIDACESVLNCFVVSLAEIPLTVLFRNCFVWQCKVGVCSKSTVEHISLYSGYT